MVLSRTMKRILIGLAVVVAAIAVFIIVFDWNLLRGYAERKVSEKTGREFSIGHLDVKLSLTPRIRLENVRFGNAAWGSEPMMVEAEVAEFTISLPAMIRGRVVLPEVAMVKPVVLLEQNEAGLRNWQLDPDKPAGETPVINKLWLDDGLLTYRNPAIATDLDIAISSDASAAADAFGIRFVAEGQYQKLATFARGRGGTVLKLADQSSPFPIDGEIIIGDTAAILRGSITNLAKFSALDLDLNLLGATMSDLFPILKLNLPKSPPYHLEGRLLHEGREWAFKSFNGRVGDSDLAGDLIVDTVAAGRLTINANLASNVLDFNDLAGFVGAPPATGPGQTASVEQEQEVAKQAAKPDAVPDEGFPPKRLRAMDADVKYEAKNVKSREALPLDSLRAHLKIQDGKLTLQPLQLGVAGGTITSQISLDARKEPVTSEASVQVRSLRLNKLAPKVKLSSASSGRISGSAQFKSTGNSAAKVLAALDGRVGLAMDGGEVSNLLLEYIGIDGGEIVKFLLAGDQSVPVRCAVAQFAIDDGLMKTETFVFDTRDTIIRGEGTVDLGKEELDLTLQPLPKDISIFSGRAPLHVTGTFKEPSFTPNKTSLATRGGAAILLGLLNPLAALIPLIETGPGEDSNCAALIAEARQQGAASDKTTPGKIAPAQKKPPAPKKKQ